MKLLGWLGMDAWWVESLHWARLGLNFIGPVNHWPDPISALGRWVRSDRPFCHYYDNNEAIYFEKIKSIHRYIYRRYCNSLLCDNVITSWYHLDYDLLISYFFLNKIVNTSMVGSRLHATCNPCWTICI